MNYWMGHSNGLFIQLKCGNLEEWGSDGPVVIYRCHALIETLHDVFLCARKILMIENLTNNFLNCIRCFSLPHAMRTRCFQCTVAFVAVEYTFFTSANELFACECAGHNKTFDFSVVVDFISILMAWNGNHGKNSLHLWFQSTQSSSVDG